MKLRIAVVAVCLIGVAAVLPLLWGQGKAGSSDATAAITKLENEGVKADLANDPSFVQKNMTDDFVGGLSLGVWEDKAAMLKAMKDPANNKTNSESISDLKVSTYGNTAIARYTETYDALRDGKPLARTVLCTDTWVKQGSAWKEAAGHCSQKAE